MVKNFEQWINESLSPESLGEKIATYLEKIADKETSDEHFDGGTYLSIIGANNVALVDGSWEFKADWPEGFLVPSNHILDFLTRKKIPFAFWSHGHSNEISLKKEQPYVQGNVYAIVIGDPISDQTTPTNTYVIFMHNKNKIFFETRAALDAIFKDEKWTYYNDDEATKYLKEYFLETLKIAVDHIFKNDPEIEKLWKTFTTANKFGL